MAEDTPKPEQDQPQAPSPTLHVAPGPHLQDTNLTTRRMMLDVIIGLAPVVVASAMIFRQYAMIQIATCVLGCLVAEGVFSWMRRRKPTLGDLSAVVTGLILALSLPAASPIWVGVIASFVAIGLGKMIFGGLGFNLFNPAMVGRAFVMLSFTTYLGAASGYVVPGAELDVITQATPLTVFKEQGVEAVSMMQLFLGNTNGSLGETSALACLLGGIYLCIRRTASWEIPAGVILAASVIAAAVGYHNPQTILFHLLGGALLFGAFFIATDPVSSPLTPKGKFLFGLGIGALVMMMRTLSAYPEGVMFSVLLMNSVTPLINRWTVPKPLGGPVPQKA